ncbi:MAG: SDR family oxidoreductase [Bryobacteraceae bacterium]
MILVTGATGTNGRELVDELHKRRVPFKAMLRNTNKRSVLPEGIETVQGDFAKPETLSRALNGVDHAFLVSPSSEQSEELEKNFIAAAKNAGVAHVVKLSVIGADLHSTSRFQRFHREAEIELENSGMGWTNLRPNLFMQTTLSYKPTIVSQNAIFASAGNSRISAVDVRDIAAVAAVALTEAGHEGKHYVITGPDPLTHTEMAAHLSEALGKDVRYVDVPYSVTRDALLQMGIPAWQVEGIIELNDMYKRGEAAGVTDTVRSVAKKESITFAQFARDFANVFLGAVAATGK